MVIQIVQQVIKYKVVFISLTLYVFLIIFIETNILNAYPVRNSLKLKSSCSTNSNSIFENSNLFLNKFFLFLL